jgi:hypothetical protein
MGFGIQVKHMVHKGTIRSLHAETRAASRLKPKDIEAWSG